MRRKLSSVLRAAKCSANLPNAGGGCQVSLVSAHQQRVVAVMSVQPDAIIKWLCDYVPLGHSFASVPTCQPAFRITVHSDGMRNERSTMDTFDRNINNKLQERHTTLINMFNVTVIQRLVFIERVCTLEQRIEMSTCLINPKSITYRFDKSGVK